MTVNPYQPNVITTPDDWRAQALCRQFNPERWFPDPSDIVAIDYAKQICHQCPVEVQCAAEHMKERFGVFGGMDEEERSRARSGRGYQPVNACGSTAGYHRHRTLGEIPCERCKASRRKSERDRQQRHRKRRAELEAGQDVTT